ncbi:MAG TPA: acetyl-CoA carboxylase carboxyltransferase subunit alpha [Rugosimonospora sp.]|nr:acetyl-CoA carboxylase carboxyltransferase subunit alpha [Rugosimonospora sp.]
MTQTVEPPVLTADWVRCGRCAVLVYEKRYRRDHRVCPDCGHHARLSAWDRVAQLLDPGSASPLPVRLRPSDPLGFVDTLAYPRRLEQAREKTGMDEAVLCVRATLAGHAVVAAIMDFRFLGGSMGSAVGELITRAAETALAERVPLLLVTASGGARMQEGVLALMQMAKTAQALAELDEAGVLTVSVVTEPTYGGVAASFATLADVIVVEPGARLGFAGPRVIEQTIRKRLPAGFQTAEFLFRGGLVDGVVPRGSLRPMLERVLRVAGAAPEPVPPDSSPLLTDPGRLPVLDPWRVVKLARHSGRPTTLDYAHRILDGFQELHGDRMGGDCPAIVGGIGRLDGVPVLLLGHQKGHTTRDLVARRFGMASPEGYRKCARLLRLAEKLRLPVLTLIDTPGAYPGAEAEERGQSVAIAENLRLLSRLTVPVVAVVTGEGGSGGALALGVANQVFACANAFYSVISPEGCASILWMNAEAAPRAASALRLDSRELLRLGIVDGVVPEPEGGAHADPAAAAEFLRLSVGAAFARLRRVPREALRRDRRRRFRAYGDLGEVTDA